MNTTAKENNNRSNREVIEGALIILNAKEPDIAKATAVLEPLKSSKYGEIITKLCDALTKESYEPYDAIAYLEEIHDDMLKEIHDTKL